MSQPRYKLTCPMCKQSVEREEINDCVLDLPHKRLCDGHIDNTRAPPLRYDASCWEDRLILNS